MRASLVNHPAQGLRTQPIVAKPPQPDTRRRCAGVLGDGEPCGTVLSRYNEDAYCAACQNAGRAVVVEVVDPKAPLCACGCGERVLRGLVSYNGHPRRTGRWQKYVHGHVSRMQGRREVVSVGETT